MKFDVFFYLAIAMGFGLLFNRLMKLIHLPNVTGYLIAGLLIGPYVLKLVDADTVASFGVISNFALGFIAFTIGNSFKIDNVRKLGKSMITITLFEALTALVFVDTALLLFGFPKPEAITLGAMSAATAPAATLLVVRQYKARGPVTSILVPVVALDDAVGLISYSISVSIASSMVNAGSLSVAQMILKPLEQILLSFAIGGGIGFLLTLCMKIFHSHANRLMCVICAIMFGVALADRLELSSLLLCMMISTVLANFFRDSDMVFDTCDRWTPPVFLMFFVISGAELNLSVLKSVGLLGACYIVFRAIGKYTGAAIGSAVEHQDKSIRKYLGATLLPQAGVAIGMSQLVMTQLPQYGEEIRAVILSGTLVYELIGPLVTKFALTKAGEIKKGAV